MSKKITPTRFLLSSCFNKYFFYKIIFYSVYIIRRFTLSSATKQKLNWLKAQWVNETL